MVETTVDSELIPAEASYFAIAKENESEGNRDHLLLIATFSVMGLIALSGLRKFI